MHERRTRARAASRGRCTCSPRTHSTRLRAWTGTTTCAAIAATAPPARRRLAVHERGEPQLAPRPRARDQLAGVDLHAAGLAGHEVDEVEARRASPAALHADRLPTMDSSWHRRARRRRGAGRARARTCASCCAALARARGDRAPLPALRPRAVAGGDLDARFTWERSSLPDPLWHAAAAARASRALRRLPLHQQLPDRLVHARADRACVVYDLVAVPDAAGPVPRRAHRAGDDPAGAAPRRARWSCISRGHAARPRRAASRARRRRRASSRSPPTSASDRAAPAGARATARHGLAAATCWRPARSSRARTWRG